MKNIPIDDAIDALANCAAIQVDGSELIYPEIHEQEDSEDCFMSLETQYGSESFSRSKNPTAQLTSAGAIVLLNDKNEPTTIAFLDVNSEAAVAGNEGSDLADFIYATTGTDEDGDHYDYGFLRAKDVEEAVRLLAKRYDDIGIEGDKRETKLCKVIPFTGPGIPKSEPPIIVRP